MPPRFGENYTRRPIMPWGKSPCPCGSGVIFRECCRPPLDDLPLRPTPWKYVDANPDLALTLARAEFTRYTIWHATNTQPWFERDPDAASELMDIDAEALGDMLAAIRRISRRHPQQPDFLGVLDQNADLLPTQRWRDVLFRERLIHTWEEADGEHNARALAKTLNLEEAQDTELLALVLPYRDELPISERLRVVERIIATTRDWEERVRFLCYRGMLWELHGDFKGAARSFLAAVEAVPNDPEPEWAHAVVVEACVHAGRSNARRDLLERGLRLCERFMQEADGEPHLLADLRKTRSEVMKRLGRDAEEVADLRWVVDHRGTYDDRIQLAQALIATQEFEEARSLLEAIPFERLTAGEQYDHTFALFGLLYGIQDADLVGLVRSRLEGLEPEFPGWREVRDRFLLALSNAPAPAEYPAWWASLRETLVLQPNIFGVGIDVGGIIDQALRHRRKGERAHRRLRGPDT